MTLDLATSIADDFEIFDATESVSLTTTAGVVTSGIAGVTSGMLTRAQRDVIGEVATAGEYRSFRLPVAELASAVPSQGDKITDAASRAWTILAVDLATCDTGYICACARQKS